jgi:hypothetical protein
MYRVTHGGAEKREPMSQRKITRQQGNKVFRHQFIQAYRQQGIQAVRQSGSQATAICLFASTAPILTPYYTQGDNLDPNATITSLFRLSCFQRCHDDRPLVLIPRLHQRWVGSGDFWLVSPSPPTYPESLICAS